MIKKVLVYRWGSVLEPAFIRALYKNGTECAEFTGILSDYHADAEFAIGLIEKLHAEKPDAVFSYDYFPIISMLCEINKIPYLSWIYDCPQYTLLSGTVRNSMNRIFCFDAVYTERIRSWGAPCVCHFPLGADTEGFGQITGKEKKEETVAEISFVGDLYGGEKNRLRHTVLSDYAAGYVEGLIRSQLKIYGYNFLAEALSDRVAAEIVEKCSLMPGENYRQEPVRMAADAVGMEASARERETVLDALSGRFPVTLYTGSQVSAWMTERRLLNCQGYVDYAAGMPFVFHGSRISLNITSRTIESGIPQRVLDILACGGFCMTNYQPEIAECFTDGEELVMYDGMEGLMEKTAYYLSHEEERQRIARRGWERVKKEFALEERVKELLSVPA